VRHGDFISPYTTIYLALDQSLRRCDDAGGTW